jgi:DNA-binding Lrp family transcriptional regulator
MSTEILIVPTAYVLLNSDLGSDETIISKVKEILDSENNIKYEIQGVYGVYDIVLKISSDNTENLRSVITNNIRKIDKVQSTLTMMVIEEQEKS